MSCFSDIIDDIILLQNSTINYNFLQEQKRRNKNKKALKPVEALGLFALVGEDGFEPSKRNAADLQSVKKWLFAITF